MSPKSVRRGSDPYDSLRFSGEAAALLTTAGEEVQWLLDRGYRLGPTVEFVGSRYQLTLRQRAAIQRASSSADSCEKRKAKLLPPEAAAEGALHIDGFNLVILLEAAISGSPIVLGRDGVLRDLAGLRGTYSVIRETEAALDLVGRCFRDLSVPEAVFYLDRPVSNSGRLRSRILAHARDWGIPVRVELVPNSDVVLAPMARVVTGDSVILDRCGSWLNLSRKIVGDYIGGAWIINLG